MADPIVHFVERQFVVTYDAALDDELLYRRQIGSSCGGMGPASFDASKVTCPECKAITEAAE